jgi:hypothetical protein
MTTYLPPNPNKAALAPLLGILRAPAGFRPGQAECIEALALANPPTDTWFEIPCGAAKAFVFAGALLLRGGVAFFVEPATTIIECMVKT